MQDADDHHAPRDLAEEQDVPPRPEAPNPGPTRPGDGIAIRMLCEPFDSRRQAQSVALRLFVAPLLGRRHDNVVKVRAGLR